MTPFELNAAATRLLHESRHAEAVVLQTQACELAKADQGADSLEYAALVANLALLHRHLGDDGAAEVEYREALEVFRSAGAGHVAQVAQVTNNLGVLVGRHGRYDEARQLLDESASIRRALGDHLALAETFVNLAALHAESREPELAASRCLEALFECESVTERPPVDLDAIFAAVPIVREAMGGDDALLANANRRRMADLVATRDPNPARAADILLQVGKVSRDIGDLALAERVVRRALDMRRIAYGDTHPSIAPVLSELGSICQETGDATSAEVLHRRAVSISVAAFGDDHPLTDKARFDLAALRASMGRHAEAGELYRAIAEHMRATPGDHRAALASVMNNLAEVQAATGQHALARAQLLEALEMYRDTVGGRHRFVGTTLHNIAKADMALGDVTDAEQRLREALRVTRAAVGADHPDVHRTLRTLAVLLAATGRDDDALTVLLEALRISDRMIEATSSISSSRRRLGYLWEISRELSTVVSLVVERLSTSPDARRAALDLVLRRKARALDATAAQRGAVLRGRHPGLEHGLRRLDRMRAQLAAATLDGGPTSGDVESRRTALRSLAWDADRLEAELSRAMPATQVLAASDVGPARVAATLAADTALVEIVAYRTYAFDLAASEEWGPWRYVGFVLTSADDDVAMVDLGPASEIDAMVAGLLDTMRGGSNRDAGDDIDDDDEIVHEGALLRAAVLDPLLGAVGSRTHLVIAPDGNLSRLPFGVLPTASGRFLIDDYRVSYVGVGRDLLRFGSTAQGFAGEPLVVAAPDYDLADVEPRDGDGTDRSTATDDELVRSGVRFGPLRGALEEGTAVAALLGVEPLVGADALEDRIRGIRSPAVLHLATHGWFLPSPTGSVESQDAPRQLGSEAGDPLLRSGLALAGANRRLDGFPLPPQAGDGLLHAADVMTMDLIDTELVVLSACDTGLGDVRNGEGVFGLRRAFQEAGARTVLMSLWKVPDEATKELMLGFYHRVLAGDSCADALRDAQLDVRHRHPHPRCWGAFVCQGEAGALSSWATG